MFFPRTASPSEGFHAYNDPSGFKVPRRSSTSSTTEFARTSRRNSMASSASSSCRDDHSVCRSRSHDDPAHPTNTSPTHSNSSVSADQLKISPIPSTGRSKRLTASDSLIRTSTKSPVKRSSSKRAEQPARRPGLLSRTLSLRGFSSEHRRSPVKKTKSGILSYADRGYEESSSSETGHTEVSILSCSSTHSAHPRLVEPTTSTSPTILPEFLPYDDLLRIDATWERCKREPDYQMRLGEQVILYCLAADGRSRYWLRIKSLRFDEDRLQHISTVLTDWIDSVVSFLGPHVEEEDFYALGSKEHQSLRALGFTEDLEAEHLAPAIGEAMKVVLEEEDDVVEKSWRKVMNRVIEKMHEHCVVGVAAENDDDEFAS